MTIGLRTPLGIVMVLLSLLAFIYLLVPILVVVAAPLGDTGYLAFPPQGFTMRWYAQALHDTRFLTAFLLSLRLAVTVAVLSAGFGVLAAQAIARRAFPGAKLVEAFFLSPLILPTLVMAVGLTIMFTRTGAPTGLWRLIAAHIVVCVPYVIRVVLPLLRRFDRSLEEAALSLGATPVGAFFLVLVPVIRPALVAGTLMAFITSFDEVVLALFLAVPGQSTLPVMIYSSVQLGFEPVVAAVSGLLVCATLVIMLILQFAGFGRRDRDDNHGN